jgi:23S rRNA (uracil1939-C5)-methyltransferase
LTIITVTALGQQGDGLALHNDKKVFVDGGLTNETLEVSLIPSPDGQSFRGSINSVIDASPHRATPACPHYVQCGGCQLQHMSEEFYRQWKQDMVMTALSFGDLSPEHIEPPVFIPDQTRRRASFKVMKQHNKAVIGYNQKRSHQIVSIKECLVLDPVLLEAKESLRPYLDVLVQDKNGIDLFLQKIGDKVDCVMTGQIGVAKEPDLDVKLTVAEIIHNTPITRISWRKKERDEPELLIEKTPIRTMMGTLSVALPPLAFLQPSEDGARALIGKVFSALPKTPIAVADLFSGNGTFTGTLLRAGHDVTAYESDEEAVNALLKAGHSKTELRDLFKEPLSETESNRFGAIVLDPPRAGAKAQCEVLAHSNVPLIVYVSCNPVSFARDAEKLVEGGYTFTRFGMVDQFIWSTHTEIVGVFTK